jgi:hypothetical protein
VKNLLVFNRKDLLPILVARLDPSVEESVNGPYDVGADDDVIEADPERSGPNG